MADETELKFLTDPDTLDALAERLGAGPPASLAAVYFDTADQRLRRAGWSLRIRDEGGRRVQTAKGPGAGPLGRSELEFTVEGEEPDLDREAAGPLRRVLDGQAPRPLFTVSTERRTALLVRGEASIEAALDRAAVAGGGARAEFHEVELELKAGRPEALFELARELTETAPLDLAFDSKAQRGYALLDGTAEPPLLQPVSDLTAGAAFRAAALANLAQAQAGAAAFLTVRSPEALHQTRVALRRLRSLLSAFRTVVADEGHASVREGLKALASGLNDARDLDVFAHDVFAPAALAADEEERDGLAALGSALHAERTRAYDGAVDLLGSHRRRRIVLDAAEWITLGAWTRSDDPLLRDGRDRPAGAFAAETLDKLRRKLKRSGSSLAALDSHDRHRVRIQAKKLRYAADAFAPLFPSHDRRRKRFFRALKALQEALGALNDRSVGRGLALRVAGPAGPEAAFAAGRLTAARERDEAPLLADAERAFADLMEAKPFWRD